MIEKGGQNLVWGKLTKMSKWFWIQSIYMILFNFQSTALDKASRYFQGRKQVPLQEFSTSTADEEEEVF